MRGYTVEMSFLMPIIMLLVMSSIYAFFYYHDKNIIAGAAYETAVVGSNTVEGDEVCVRAQGTWRKMKVSVEKRAAITEPEKKLRDIKKIKEFVNGT